MVDIKPILNVGLAAQSASLAVSNVKLIKKPTPKKLIKQSVNNIFGITLIKAQGNIINTL